MDTEGSFWDCRRLLLGLPKAASGTAEGCFWDCRRLLLERPDLKADGDSDLRLKVPKLMAEGLKLMPEEGCS